MAAPRASADQYVLDYARVFGLPTRRLPDELPLRAAPVRHRGPGLDRALPDPGAAAASRSRSTATAGRCATRSSSTMRSRPGSLGLAPCRPAARPRLQPRRRARQHAQPARAARAHRARSPARPPRSRFAEAAARRPALVRLRHDAFAAATGWRAARRPRRRACAGWSTGWPAHVVGASRAPASAAAHEGRAGQPELELRRQHLFRLPRAASAARARLVPGAAGARGPRRPRCSTAICSASTAATSRPSSPRFRPDLTVVTTAPTYLFWRCAPPELRVPMALVAAIRDGRRPRIVAVGPHGSTTPARRLAQARRRRRGDGRVRGGRGARSPAAPGRACRASRTGTDGAMRVNGGPQAARFVDATAARLAGRVGRPPPPPPPPLRRRTRSAPAPRSRPRAAAPTAAPSAPRRTSATATAAASPARWWRRPPGCGRRASSTSTSSTRSSCPTARCSRGWSGCGLKFGVQTRIDLWKPDMLELLGRAGCVSIEAGVESLTREGRDELAKNCKLDDRGAGRPADRGQAPRAVRAGQPARDAAGR